MSIPKTVIHKIQSPYFIRVLELVQLLLGLPQDTSYLYPWYWVLEQYIEPKCLFVVLAPAGSNKASLKPRTVRMLANFKTKSIINWTSFYFLLTIGTAGNIYWFGVLSNIYLMILLHVVNHPSQRSCFCNSIFEDTRFRDAKSRIFCFKYINSASSFTLSSPYLNYQF